MKLYKQLGFSIIELIGTVGIFAILFFTMSSGLMSMQRNSLIHDEKNFLDNFFYNVSRYGLSNETLFKDINHSGIMSLRTSNQALSKATLDNLYQMGLITKSHTINENGSIYSSLGPMIIYPYGLDDKLNGKLTSEKIENSKNEEASSFYTISYPLVDENKCEIFLEFIQKSSAYQKYTVLVNNIQMSSAENLDNINNISGDDKHLQQVCKTDERHHYNVIQISNQ